MNDRQPSGARAVPTAFVALLIAVFALLSLALMMTGTRVYRRMAREAAQTSDAQIALSYLCNKLRAYDALGCVTLENYDGVEALALRETIDGESYETDIYGFDGALCERFAFLGDPFAPGDGERLVSAQGISFRWLSPALLEATLVTAEGETCTMRMALRTGGAGEAE